MEDDNMKKLRAELNDLLRPLKQKDMYKMPSHIVVFGDENDSVHVFLYDTQVDTVIDFLETKVNYFSIYALGRTVATYYKYD